MSEREWGEKKDKKNKQKHVSLLFNKGDIHGVKTPAIFRIFTESIKNVADCSIFDLTSCSLNFNLNSNTSSKCCVF